MKTCNKCKESKPLDCYYPKVNYCKVCRRLQVNKYEAANREKVRARSKKYWAANREKMAPRRKQYRVANREKLAAYHKNYYRANREKVAASQKKYHSTHRTQINMRDKKRYKTDPVFATTRRLRCRIRNWLKGRKSAPTEELVGCTFKECKRWIERQFVDGMSWENRDKWHIDHMVALKTFDMMDPEQQRIACHYTNLQPMWGPENCSKGSKIVYDMVWKNDHWYINVNGSYISRLKLVV